MERRREHTFHTDNEVDLPTPRAVVIPIRSARPQRIDLAWALAVLSKGVKAHERAQGTRLGSSRSEEHTSELQSRVDLVCRLLLEKKKKKHIYQTQIKKIQQIQNK